MARLSPRQFAAALAVLALTGAVPDAAAQPPTFASVAVDVSHLRSLGVGPFADIVQGAMTDELRRAFADRMGGRGDPRLVVRVTGLFLTSSGTSRSSGGHGISTDSVDGEALIVGPRGEILARYPQHNSLVPTATWYDPLAERKRADAVARNYAQWLRRYTIR